VSEWTAKRPDETVAAVRSFEGPVLLDLDETLYLRSSTESFIDSIRPALAVLIVLRLLDIATPWRWSGGEVTRDVWRVRVVRVLFPWAGQCWRVHVADLANRHENIQLASAVRQRNGTAIVVTAGFRPVVTPLLAAMGFGGAQLVAARVSATDRLRGKLAMAREALGDDLIKRSLVVTDSRDDIPLLEMCARPCLTIWPEARYVPAMMDVYFPGLYLSRVKRPGQRYVWRGVLQEDFAYWVLASITLAASPFTHALGLVCLLLSFWCIYERGYVDNDVIASRFEPDPTLSAAFGVLRVATPRLAPWVWAMAAGALGLFIVRSPAPPTTIDAVRWGCVLVSTHVLFTIYNRLDKTSRVWLFAGLQLARAASFAAIVPVTIAGSLALGAHVVARWMPYYLYRYGRTKWSEGSLCLSRLLIFAVLCASAATAIGPGRVADWSCLLLVLWSLYRARNELSAVLGSARRIDRPIGDVPAPPLCEAPVEKSGSPPG
jgi:hypothetical protein